jgi:hypothetical protein
MTMSLESPPRLKHDTELGPILRAADTATVSAERIASNGAAVKATIAAGLVRATSPLWKLGLPLLLIVSAVIVQRQLADRAVIVEPPPLELAVPSDPSSSIDLATTHAEHEELVAAPVPEPAKPAPVRAIEPPPAPVAPPAPASELPEQIRLYEAARAASARREFTQGLEHLAELLRRFPSTPLRAEAELTRADLLTRADRLDEAVAALEALAIDESHRGRRGELLRTIGDLRRKQGDCVRAIAAYTRARATTLSATEKPRVERGMERCARPR